MRHLAILALILIPAAAAQPFHALRSEGDPTSLEAIRVEAAHGEAAYTFGLLVHEEGDVANRFVVGTERLTFTNATIVLEPRSVVDHYLGVFADGQPELQSSLALDQEPTRHDLVVDALPLDGDPRTQDVAGACMHAGSIDIQLTGAFTVSAYGYVITIQHDGGQKEYVTGEQGPGMAIGGGAANTESQLRLTLMEANLTTVLKGAQTELYHGQCPVASSQTKETLVSLPIAVAPPAPTAAMAPMPAQDNLQAEAIGAVALLPILAWAALPCRRLAKASLDKKHYHASAAWASLSLGHEARVLHAQALDGCRRHRQAARVFQKCYHARPGADLAQRAATSHALNGDGRQAAVWLMMAEAEEPGVMDRIQERHFKRVTSDATFRALAGHLTGI